MAETLETGHEFPAVQPDQRNSVQGDQKRSYADLCNQVLSLLLPSFNPGKKAVLEA
jgi:hypothetical protein